MDKKLTSQKIYPPEMNKHSLQYKLLLTTQQNTNIPNNYSAVLSVNIKWTSLYTLLRIHY